ncbi:hypothetical protein [Kordia sp.]|uniref:hypothetical protein n=1 Tax=Kordia sp. TaxID=1965332 RepID=UPI003D6C6547
MTIILLITLAFSVSDVFRKHPHFIPSEVFSRDESFELLKSPLIVISGGLKTSNFYRTITV